MGLAHVRKVETEHPNPADERKHPCQKQVYKFELVCQLSPFLSWPVCWVCFFAIHQPSNSLALISVWT